ncbi:MAG: tRNA pseudouridine(38-40) synthase TruA [Gammaproteobacteria bacterium]|nr:tRNA pseudouridine(38-40) synthase TruA [Gammaproteobacteria bacterium]
MNLVVGVEYDGSSYCGWQRQNTGPSVQETLEAALSTIADEPVKVTAAGRTDTGVHACGQVVHFRCTKKRPLCAWVRGSNTVLPDSIVVLWSTIVGEDFHARFSAIARRYCYVILNRAVRPTYLAKRVAWDYRPLDVPRMVAAAPGLIGRHDFSAYRAASCQAKTSVRELRRLDVERRGDWVLIHVEADAFLHHMVRNLAGVLIAIGAREQHPDWAYQVLQSRDRTQAGVTAPPEGLYLMSVTYPDKFDLPCPTLTSPFW